MSFISCTYSSCACNKTPRALDWGKNKIICYGACNAIQFIKYEESTGGKHILSAVGHKKIVTSVHWISKTDGGPENELISTSADETAIIWTFKESECVATEILKGHKGVVKTSSTSYLKCKDSQCLLIATSSADSSIRIWERCTDLVECKQVISLGNGFALDLKLAELMGQEDIILIVGSDDANIHIYSQVESMFNLAVKLHGHEDWIQSLDVMHNENGDLFLTSASQDNYIRIWKISVKSEKSTRLADGNLKVEETLFQSKGYSYCVSLESVLSGHDNWIYSVKWRPIKNSKYKSLEILSSSMDKTMIIWEPDSTSSMWLEKVRVGGVGGNTLGFYGSVFSPCGEIIIAYSFQGAVHIWQYNQELDCWQSGISFGGHSDSVQDIDWDPSGEFLLSCSSDQTTRLHAPFVINSENNWHEIARPQVHGYDMVCLSALGRYKLVSAGDEKVLRVFEAPRNFAETLENLCKLDVSSYVKDKLPEGASLPSLGLSNKAVFNEDLKKADSTQEIQQKHAKDQYPDFYYTPIVLKAPPTEETLLQNTLWPEIQKLYGHPYEVFTVATNNSGTLVASACKASKPEHAAVSLWSTSTWRQVGQLVFHNLTVTQLEFSPNDEHLLSVSRDRMWVLYSHFPEESPPYRKIANLDKKNNVHTRIIWSCAWTFNSLYFATASRDKKVAIWGKNEPTTEQEFGLCCKPLEVEDSATAVAIAPSLTASGRYILAVGLENGCILLCMWCKSEDVTMIQKLGQNIAHHLNINRLKFSPVVGEAGCKEKRSEVLQLASCGSDHHTKIYQIVTSCIP